MTTEQTPTPVHGGATVLVAAKSVPVGGRHLRVTGDALAREGISHGLDPVNETAVEWALQLREHGDAKRIVAATMGAADSEDALRRALAMGCDEALRVTGDGLAGGDVRVTAHALAAAVRVVGATLAVFGYESLDGSSGTVPAAVAGLLGWPLVSRMRAGSVADGTLRAERNVERGTETVATTIPVVVSLVDGAVHPRYPSVRDLLAARRRPVAVLDPQELRVKPAVSPRERVARIEPIPPIAKEPTLAHEDEGADAVLALLAEAGALGG